MTPREAALLRAKVRLDVARLTGDRSGEQAALRDVQGLEEGMIEPISIKALLGLTHTLQLRGVPYLWGGKCDLSKSDPTTVLSRTHGIDCSGFVQLAAFLATGKKVRLPEGSVEIHEHVKTLLKPVKYAAIGSEQVLYVAFIEPENGHAGHVWFEWAGWTCESHGGKGVDRRLWNTPVLIHEVAACYVWPHTV